MTDTFPVTIFISYGRQDAAGFVDKLVDDLKLADIGLAGYCRRAIGAALGCKQIHSALKQANVVVAVLTPHSVQHQARWRIRPR